MDLQTFLESFDTIAEAPNGIQKLRSLILDLAVRGKLVPQSSDDESAEKLLKSIFNKHISLEKNFRKPKELPPIENVDKPFELPDGWYWCRFTEIGQLDRGRSKHRPRNDPSLYKNGSIPLVQTGDVARAKGVITTYTALYNEKGCAQSRLWPKGTLCITIAANIADSAILGFDACFPDSIVGFLPTEPISDSRYFEFFMRTLKSHLEDFAPSTAQKNINLAILDEVLIPLPPLAEQRRIVEKVDELMALCDRYEAAKQTRDNLRKQLRESAIATLMNAETDEELNAGWAIVRDNWCELSQNPEDVDILRQVIVQLAVEGKLSSQDPADEPASFVIKRALEKREILTALKKIGKREPQDPLEDDEIPFKLPSGWECIRLGEIADIVSGVTKGRKLIGRETASYPYLRVANVQRWHLDLEVMKEIEIPIEELDKYRLQIGDVLLTEGGDWDKLGRSAIWQGEIEDCIHQNHVFRARLLDGGILPEWTVMFTNSLVGRRYFESAAKRTTNLASINMTQLRFCPFPVPPEEEQKRIVAKVEELMKMCDRLEESLRQSQQRAEALAASAISHLEV